ncbi:MAG: GldG family protein [Verrucomicrobia bacterium]|jgi:hypothetical protein|nr:GldG family protein [Verrucomicrobiota bacterium]
MTKRTEPRPTFSAVRRWSARLAVLVSTVCVLAIVVMVNVASQRHFSKRFFLSTRTEVRLSAQTLGLLQGLTNDVVVTLYFDREAALYPTVSALLNEYRLACPRIQVRTVDYLRDPAEAAEVKIRHGLDSAQEKDLVVFECEGRDKVVPGTILAQYELERVPNTEELEFRKKPVLFLGEQVFSAVILAVSNPKPFKAYFLTGHGEHSPESGDEQTGYLKFASLLQQNYVEVHPLSLLGTNRIPEDCNLLVIAGPVQPLFELELERLGTYLDQGGRLLAMVNYQSTGRVLGIERLLEKWGVKIGAGLVRDPDNTISGTDVVSADFGSHTIMNPILGSRVHLILPRPVGAVSTNAPAADAPVVASLVSSGPRSVLLEAASGGLGRHSLAVAVERAEAAGVVTERGATRMVILGDSIVFGNQLIESVGNRDFANALVNWLLDRTVLLEGVGPRPVAEYRLVMTDTQFARIRWVLLAGLPAAVLACGGILWLSRRS